MPYSGRPDLLSADAARVMVGDVSPTAPLLDDETWASLLAATGNNVGLAAHRGALALEGKYAGLADKTVGPLKISYSQKAKAYHDLAINLLASASADPLAVRYVAPMAGGLTDPASGDPIPNFFGRSWP